MSLINNYIKDILSFPYYVGEKKIGIEDLRNKVQAYISAVKVDNFRYRFSNSVEETTLFSSVYAALVYGLLDMPLNDVNGWMEFLSSFQDEDGIWRDRKHPFRNWTYRDEEWNDIHIIPHIIYVYEAIGKTPRKEFVFLSKFLDENYVKNFCDSIDFENFWGASNGVMNYLVSLIYACDVMGESKYYKAIEYIILYLEKYMNNTKGVFTGNRDKKSLYEAIRGGYHVWMLMIQKGVVFHEKIITNIIDTILSIQNNFGGFNDRIIADVCHNIDCIDPLTRFSLMMPDYRRDEVTKTLKKARNYLLSNMNQDGGFCFSRMNKMFYGNCSLISARNESNMFGTWFTLLALLIIEEYLSGERLIKSSLPGMQYRLKDSL